VEQWRSAKAFASKPRFEVPFWNLKNGISEHILFFELNQTIDKVLVKDSPECAALALSEAPFQMRIGMMM
jgi:hypothetical protein